MNSMDMSLSKLREMSEDTGAWRAAVHGFGHNLTTQQQQHASKVKISTQSLIFKSYTNFHPPRMGANLDSHFSLPFKKKS